MIHFQTPNITFDLNEYKNEKLDEDIVIVGDVIVSIDPDGILNYRLIQDKEIPDENITVKILKNNGYLKVLSKWVN